MALDGFDYSVLGTLVLLVFIFSVFVRNDSPGEDKEAGHAGAAGTRADAGARKQAPEML